MIKNNKDFVMIKILYFHTKLKGNHTLFYYSIFFTSKFQSSVTEVPNVDSVLVFENHLINSHLSYTLHPHKFKYMIKIIYK